MKTYILLCVLTAVLGQPDQLMAITKLQGDMQRMEERHQMEIEALHTEIEGLHSTNVRLETKLQTLETEAVKSSK